MLDLGPRARTVFALVYLAAQAALVATAGARSEHAFGFRMFSESSTITVHLTREVPGMSGHGGTMTVDVPPTGEWIANGADGRPHKQSYFDRVKDPVLAHLDQEVFASYGVDAQLARLRAALADVAAHIPEDAETVTLVADVTVRRNGHEPFHVKLESPPRLTER